MTSAPLLFLISALRNLLRNARRTVAVLATVACGTGILYVYHGFNTGIMSQYRENAVHSIAGHGIVMPKGYWGQTFERPWDHWITRGAETQAKLAAIPGVTHVFPRVTVNGLLTNGRMTVNGRGIGVAGPDEAAFFTALNVEEGHNFTTEPDGILLGKGLAHALDAHPGDHVTLLATTIDGTMNAEDFTVTGVFHTGSKFVDDALFRIPIERAQSLLASDKVESFGIGLADTWGWKPVGDAIARELPEMEPVPFEAIDKLYYKNAVEFLAAQYRVMQLIILAIVVLGILSTITASVLERKQEIGNYRANGESKWDVLRLLLIEGVALGAIGGVLGVLLGLFLVNVVIPHGVLMPPAPGLTRQFYVRVELQTVEAWRAFGIGIVACAIGTAVAAGRVNRLTIAESLRGT